MASRAGGRTPSQRQQKTAGNQPIETNACRPSPLQVSKTSKSEPVTPKKLLRYLQQNPVKQVTVEDSEDQKFKNSQQDTTDLLSKKLESSSSLGGPKEQAKNKDLEVIETRGSLEGGGEEKKTSVHSSVKYSSASAKISDGASSLGKTSGSAKISDRADFIESGKSSICRGSTSTDLSEESTCSSLSSSVSKPHKANDSRWEAIQAVRVRDGMLGLSHFRLLKRLGCGDIGSVYLSELSGTKCYFAMKVMDKGSLASRKKLLRAQTEREILQSLDHPFLPTLYTHFETDKFSCLVMEFCPGGDLHTLRQRQAGKHFTEQAVKYDS